MLTLTSGERRALRAKAHGLAPVVAISAAGLSNAVLAEIDRALNAHQLVKLRTFSDSRDERGNWLTAICEHLRAAPVQHIGKVLVVYRPAAADNPAGVPAKRRRRGPRKTKKQMLSRP